MQGTREVLGKTLTKSVALSCYVVLPAEDKWFHGHIDAFSPVRCCNAVGTGK